MSVTEFQDPVYPSSGAVGSFRTKGKTSAGVPEHEKERLLVLKRKEEDIRKKMANFSAWKVQEIGAMRMDSRERKRLENKRIEKLGGTVEKAEKTPYSILKGRRKKEKEREKKKRERERELGISIPRKKRKRDTKSLEQFLREKQKTYS